MEAIHLAIAWSRHNRFPSEVLALPPGERAFIYAAQEIAQEQENKPTKPEPSGTSGGQPKDQARSFRKDVLEGR